MDRRRSSTGKSTYIDLAITIIEEFQSAKGDLVQLIAKSLDRLLFNEIRSIAWRVFLGILPSKSCNEWVSLSKKQRLCFDAELNKLSNESKFIDGEITAEEAAKVLNKKDLDTIVLLNSIVKELTKKNNIFNSLSESAQKIFLVWLQKNENILVEHVPACFRILLTLMFALYPSMINVSAENSDIANDNVNPKPKELLYFLNCEDYFDHDIFSIFSEIMTRGISELITSTCQTSNVSELFSKINSCEKKGKLIGEALKTSTRSEVSFVFFLGVADESLLKELINKNRDLNWLFNSLISSFLCDFDSVALIYFWDCVFACENDSSFDYSKISKHVKRFSFLDLLTAVIISKTKPNILMEGEVKSITTSSICENLTETDLKAIVLAALKLREKVTNLFEDC